MIAQAFGSGALTRPLSGIGATHSGASGCRKSPRRTAARARGARADLNWGLADFELLPYWLDCRLTRTISKDFVGVPDHSEFEHAE